MPIHLSQRFDGEDGREALIAALAQQELVRGDRVLADQLAEKSALVEVPSGGAVMLQGEDGSDIYLIVAGHVSIQVNGREVVTRGAGQHVGEMALIDPQARRSASVFATEPVVLARVAEPSFVKLAQEHPLMWRVLARELGDRLRARDRMVPARNPEPQLLVVASGEAAGTAKRLHALFGRDGVESKLWSDALFGAEDYLVDALQSVLETTDFAVLVLAAEDWTGARRDNAVFALGLFIGTLGRERVILVAPAEIAASVPEATTGPAPLAVGPGTPESLDERLAPVAASIAGFAATRGPR